MDNQGSHYGMGNVSDTVVLVGKLMSHRRNERKTGRGRNDLCVCNSGKKHKLCCGQRLYVRKAVDKAPDNATISHGAAIRIVAIMSQMMREPDGIGQDEMFSRRVMRRYA